MGSEEREAAKRAEEIEARNKLELKNIAEREQCEKNGGSPIWIYGFDKEPVCLDKSLIVTYKE